VVSFLLAFPPITYASSSSPLHSCFMPCPSQLPQLDHSNYTWQRVQLTKLLFMQFSPHCHFIPLWSTYSPQHPVLKDLKLCSSLNIRGQVSHTHTHTHTHRKKVKMIDHCILILTYRQQTRIQS
jgi:hypothetical protein